MPTALFAKVAGLGAKREGFAVFIILVATELGRRDWSRTLKCIH